MSYLSCSSSVWSSSVLLCSYCSALIKESIASGSMEQAVSLFQELAGLADYVKTSHCQHLKQYVEGVCEELKEVLKDKLSG